MPDPGEKFDIGTFFRGFNIFSGPVFGKLAQQVVMILVVLALVGGIWYKMFGQRTESTKQTAESITNIDTTSRDKFNLLKVKILGFGN